MAPKTKFTKEEFVETALHIVRKGGFPALTAQALAEELHSSTRPVFTCFGTMDELKKEVYLAAVGLYKKYEMKGMKQKIPFLGVGIQYIRFAKEEPGLYRMLFLTQKTEDMGGAMDAMEHLKDMVRDSLMQIYHLDAAAAERYFRDMWFVVHSLATLIVTGDCPYSEQEISQILTGFSVSICRSIKEIPGFLEGTFDKDEIFRELIRN